MSEDTATEHVYPPLNLDAPQLTIRAVVTGMLLGGILSLCNVYMGPDDPHDLAGPEIRARRPGIQRRLMAAARELYGSSVRKPAQAKRRRL